MCFRPVVADRRFGSSARQYEPSRGASRDRCRHDPTHPGRGRRPDTGRRPGPLPRGPRGAHLRGGAANPWTRGGTWTHNLTERGDVRIGLVSMGAGGAASDPNADYRATFDYVRVYEVNLRNPVRLPYTD